MYTNTDADKAEIREDLAKEHFKRILSYEPDTDEQIRLIEALLIDYFKTAEYNRHFTQGISLNTKTFSNIKDMDVDAVVVEVNNENIGYLNIFSQTAQPNYFHSAILDIRASEGRVSVFDLLKH